MRQLCDRGRYAFGLIPHRPTHGFWGNLLSTSINTHDGVTVFLTSATEADVHADGAVMGIQAVDGDALRDRVVAFVQERAQRLGVPATAALIDDSSHWTLTIEPDGRVTEAPTGLVTESFEPRPTSAEPKPHRPTVEDLLSSRPRQRPLKATTGWQGQVRRMSGGLISPKPSSAEQTRHDQTNRVQKRLDGPRTIVVLNPKGGAHKTTSTLLLAATFGRLRGGSTLAWDNNETRGTLGWRAQHTPHHRTAVDLLNDLDRFENPSVASLSQLDDYVRTQVDARFDVLASDEDAAATSTIDDAAFDRLHRTLSRYYRLLIVDTGNNMRASNWVAAVAAADQLVIVSTVREDTAASAAWLLDGLAEKGFGDKVDRAVTILTSPSEKPDRDLEQRLADHFGALTAAVTTIPYDAALVDGGTIDFDALSSETHDAWLNAAAVVADQL